MLKFLAAYYIVIAIVIVISVAATAWLRLQRKRVRNDAVPPGYVETPEVFTDPTTGVVQKVWYNPQTGERFYQTIRRDPSR